MTTRRSMAAMTVALGLFAAMPVAAQRSMSHDGPGGGRGNRLNFLAGYLSLTDAQKTQAQSIFDAAETASETARGQLTSAREALHTAVKATASDAELDRLGAAAGVVEGQLAAIQAKANSKFYALLTAEQKTKYDQTRTRGGRR